MILLLLVVPVTYSKFQSNPSTDVKVLTAFYLLNAEYQSENIKLDSIIPSENEYMYDFSVANFENNDRCETDMEYEIVISSTTNLPLEYKLYEVIDNVDTELLTTNQLLTDDDGMYFKELKTEKYEFSYLTNQKRVYRLGINFPIEYSSIDYQGIIEGVVLNINSKQIIDEVDD